MNCMPKAVSLSPYTKKSLEKKLEEYCLGYKIDKKRGKYSRCEYIQ